MDDPDPRKVEERVLASVEAAGASFQAVRIDPAYANTADFCRRYGYPPEASVNCIVVATKTGPRRYAACCVQATRRLDVNGVVRRRLGARKVSFARAQETVALTGMVPDGVTPFGLPDGVPLWIDAPIVQQEQVVVGGGSRRLKLVVSPAALLALPGAEVIEGLARADR